MEWRLVQGRTKEIKLNNFKGWFQIWPGQKFRFMEIDLQESSSVGAYQMLKLRQMWPMSYTQN